MGVSQIDGWSDERVIRVHARFIDGYDVMCELLDAREEAGSLATDHEEDDIRRIMRLVGYWRKGQHMGDIAGWMSPWINRVSDSCTRLLEEWLEVNA